MSGLCATSGGLPGLLSYVLHDQASNKPRNGYLPPKAARLAYFRGDRRGSVHHGILRLGLILNDFDRNRLKSSAGETWQFSDM
jgi:hypothetical protein